MRFFPPEIAAMATEAAEAKGVTPVDWNAFETRAAPVAALPKQEPDATCYLQHSRGSTRFPHGVAVTHAALLNNPPAPAHGMPLPDSASFALWTPRHTDTGMVCFFPSPGSNSVPVTHPTTKPF